MPRRNKAPPLGAAADTPAAAPDRAAAPRSARIAAAVPHAAGIGLRAPHVREILERRPPIAWLEVHSENYFCEGGPQLAHLARIRADYPLSLHGVGLGLGSAGDLDRGHVARLKVLIDSIEPGLVSEHVCWGRTGKRHLNDLLPLPYTEEALEHLCRRVDEAQLLLGRRLLMENVSSYVRWRHDTMPEWEFVVELVRRTGCGLLLDVNNIYVISINHGWDARTYLRAVCDGIADRVEEIHLAGFDEDQGCLIDTHGQPVCEAVWQLYRETIARLGPRPTLIERDTAIPPLELLLAERDRAQAVLEEQRHALPA